MGIKYTRDPFYLLGVQCCCMLLLDTEVRQPLIGYAQGTQDTPYTINDDFLIFPAKTL